MKPIEIRITYGKLQGSVWVVDNNVVKTTQNLDVYNGFRWSTMLSILTRHGGSVEVVGQ